MRITMLGSMVIDGEEQEGIFIEATHEEREEVAAKANLFRMPECSIFIPPDVKIEIQKETDDASSKVQQTA